MCTLHCPAHSSYSFGLTISWPKGNRQSTIFIYVRTVHVIYIFICIIPARQVPAADDEKLAKKEGLLFFEVCAKTNQNILQMFYSAVVELPFF